MSSRYTAEDIERHKREIRATLAGVNEMLHPNAEHAQLLPPDEPEPEAVPWPRWESGPSRNDRLIRYGIRLSDPHGLERWREEARAAAKERECRDWRQWIMKQEHRLEVEQWLRERILTERQVIFEAIAKCFDLYLPTDKIQEQRAELERDIYNAVHLLSEERKRTDNKIQEAIGELRAELNMQREHAAKFGEVIDLPSPLIRKVRDNAA
jgi:hypothetical protein